MKLFILKIQVVYTSIMIGMMLMYIVTLGSYFNYILKVRLPGAFQDYAQFRNNTRVQIHHTIVLIGQFILSIISLIVNYDELPYIDELQRSIDYSAARNQSAGNQLKHVMDLVNNELPEWLREIKKKYK